MLTRKLNFILIILSTALFSSVKAVSDDDIPLLLLVSFDGFRWDYLENNTLNNFQQYFVNNGVKAKYGLINSFSTVTFPNHWTLATGLYPESHGIVANVIYDSTLNETYADFGSHDNDTRWFGQNSNARPIWILNQLQDKLRRRSGIIGSYPGSNVPIANTTAFITDDYKEDDDTNWFLKVDKLVSWYLDKENPINMGVLYFPEPDEYGHQYGPYSEQVVQKIHECDNLVGYLVQKLKSVGLYDRMNIIITSDHGMDTASLENSINLSDYVNITKFKSYGGLTEISIFPNDPEDEEEIYQALKNIPHYNVYRKNEVLQRLNYKHNIRIGPIVMYGDVGHEIFRENKEKFDWNNWHGDHGGDNQQMTMHPIFVATGPAFKKNYTKDTFNNTDVYILMCTILGLTPAQHNGSFDNIKDLLVDNYKLSTQTPIETFNNNNQFSNPSKYIVFNFNVYEYNNDFNALFAIFLCVTSICIFHLYSYKTKKYIQIHRYQIKHV